MPTPEVPPVPEHPGPHDPATQAFVSYSLTDDERTLRWTAKQLGVHETTVRQWAITWGLHTPRKIARRGFTPEAEQVA